MIFSQQQADELRALEAKADSGPGEYTIFMRAAANAARPMLDEIERLRAEVARLREDTVVVVDAAAARLQDELARARRLLALVDEALEKFSAEPEVTIGMFDDYLADRDALP